MDAPFVQQGIRHITPEQAARLRARIRRDVDYYHRLSLRLTRWHMRDRSTHDMICAVSRVNHSLRLLMWAAHDAGAGPPPPHEVWSDNWQGDGI
jgi:hypothetical protein